MNYTLLIHYNFLSIFLYGCSDFSRNLWEWNALCDSPWKLVINPPEGFNKKNIVFHATLAFLEIVPVLGGVIAVIEKVVVFVFQVLSSVSSTGSTFRRVVNLARGDL